MLTFLQDLRYSTRMLRKHPGFTTVAVLTLALGMGGTTAIFSLMNAVMLKTLPVQDPEKLVLLNWTCQERPYRSQIGRLDIDKTGRFTSTSFSYPAFQELQAHNQAFSTLFGFFPLSKANVSIDGQASLAEGELVTGRYFSGLGVSPGLGRAINDEDAKPSAPRVAVLSYGYWERAFGRSTSVIGKAISVNEVPVTIVGVAQPDFFGVRPGAAVDFWLPLIEDSHLLPPFATRALRGRSLLAARDWWWVMIMGRLKPGVSPQQATAELEVLFQQSTTADVKPSLDPRRVPHIQLEPASRGLRDLREHLSKPLWILMALEGLGDPPALPGWQ